MRIPKIVAAVSAVTLAFGASLAVGLTASADAVANWTVDSITSPLLPDGTLEFSGTHPSDEQADDVTVTPFGESEVSVGCTGLDAGNTSWSCSYTPAGGFPVGEGTITFFFTGAGSSAVPFTVSAFPDPTPSPTPSAVASGPPGMTYDFSPAAVTAHGEPTDPATKVAIEFYDFTNNPSDYWESHGGCPAPGSENGTFFEVTNTCSVSGLTPGILNIYSQQDTGDGETGVGVYADDYIVIPNTPVIDYSTKNGDYTVYLQGTSDLGFGVNILDNGEAIDCPVAFVEGNIWTCTTSVLDPGSHTFTAYAVDNGGNSTEAVPVSTYVAGGQSAISDPLEVTFVWPAVSYTLVPGGFTVDSTPTGDGTVARTDLYQIAEGEYVWIDSCGGPAPESGEGYYWVGDRFSGIASGQENYGCSFLDLPPGLYTIESQQDDGTGGPAYDTIYSSFVISDAPTITDWYWSGGEGEGPSNFVDIDGTATPGYLVHVVDTDLQDVCDPALADSEGYWSCTTDGLPAGIQILSAYSEDTGAGESLIPYYWGNTNYTVGGLSALSDPIAVPIDTPLVPEMSYEFVPGGVVIDGDPTGLATVIRTDLYSWNLADGFQVVDNCGGPPYEGEGGGEGGAFDPFLGITPGPIHCVFTDLTPGVWNPYSQQDTGDGETQQYEWVDDYFVVPATPSIGTATVLPNGAIALSGTTVAGNAVHVLTGSSQIVCDSAPASVAGLWSCTTPALPNGGYNLRAYSEDLGAGENEAVPDSVYLSGGLSALSAVKPVTVAIEPLPGTGGTGGTPPPTLITPSWFFTLNGVDLGNLHPGDKFTISGSGLPAGSKVSAELHSTPVSLGQATVGSSGTFALSATVPENVEPGDHTVVVTVTGDGLAPSTKEQAVTVIPVEESAGHSTDAGGTAADTPLGEANDGHGGSDASATAPNILTNSMNPIVEVLSDPGRIPAAFAVGLVLIIFAIVPAHLLNSTVAEQYERLTRRIPRLKTAPRWYTAVTTAVAKAPVLGGILLMAATGFLFALADPTFGPNLHSLRLIIALSAALFVVFFIANSITAAIMRRAWNVDVVVKLRPFGLVLTVAGVVVSRLLEFSPGILIGIVLGLSIATSSATGQAWKAVLIRSSVIVTFGIASWIIYSSIADGVHHDPTFFNEVVLEFFVAIATEGIVLLLVELMPLHMLEGERLFKRSRVLWGSVYLVVLTMFVLAVVPWAGNWRELGESFWPWFSTVALFGAACVAIYLFFRFIAAPVHGEHLAEIEDEEDSDERIALGNDR